MARNKGKKLKLLKGEKIMYGVIVLLIALIPILNVYTSAIVTRTNIAVEELKNNIENQKEENESLSMQIDELASLENIQAIAKEYGLSYNNTNILQIK
ncbi:MAG: cell division protein FtsL [Bacilli bacterium]|nr:cell division protein FtsL [Bacilli bacterium]